jgi:hypothetical protein
MIHGRDDKFVQNFGLKNEMKEIWSEIKAQVDVK